MRTKKTTGGIAGTTAGTGVVSGTTPSAEVVRDPYNEMLTGTVGGKNTYGKDYNLKLSDKKLFQTMLKRVGVGMWPRLAAQVDFGNQFEPQRQSAIQSMATLLNPANLSALLDAYGRKANANAIEQNRLFRYQPGSQGLGSGALEGARLGALNKAASDTNAQAAKLYSAEGMRSAYEGLMKALDLAQQAPSLAQILQLAGQVPAQQTQSAGAGQIFGIPGGNALLGALGGLAGL